MSTIRVCDVCGDQIDGHAVVWLRQRPGTRERSSAWEMCGKCDGAVELARETAGERDRKFPRTPGQLRAVVARAAVRRSRPTNDEETGR